MPMEELILPNVTPLQCKVPTSESVMWSCFITSKEEWAYQGSVLESCFRIKLIGHINLQIKFMQICLNQNLDNKHGHQ